MKCGFDGFEDFFFFGGCADVVVAVGGDCFGIGEELLHELEAGDAAGEDFVGLVGLLSIRICVGEIDDHSLFFGPFLLFIVEPLMVISSRTPKPV